MAHPRPSRKDKCIPSLKRSESSPPTHRSDQDGDEALFLSSLSDPPGGEVNVKEMFAELSAKLVAELSALSKASTSKLEATINGISEKFSARLETLTTAHAETVSRVTEVEPRVSSLEDRINTLESSLTEVQKQNSALTRKVTDLEGRSRRDNLRILGLKEGIEGDNPVKFFETWLPRAIGLEDDCPTIKMDRAHRSLGPRSDDRSRPVVIKLHYSSDKPKVLAAVKARQPLRHENRPFRIVQDLPHEVLVQRREFNTVCSTLVEKGIRFHMQYPAILFISHGGERHPFRSPQKAQEFLSGRFK